MEFKTETLNEIFIIHAPESWKKETNALFSESAGPWYERPEKKIVLDCSKMIMLDIEHVGAIVSFSKNVKNNGKEFYLVNANHFLQMKFKNANLFQFLTFCQSIDEAKTKKATGPKPTIDVRIINPFIEAALSTLSVQCNVKTTSKPLYLKTRNDQPRVEIAGVISLICDQFKGSTSLCFTNQVFLNIYEAMIGEKHTEINNEIQDAASELINIIYGIAKTELNTKLNTNLQSALPTLLMGEKIRIHQKTSSPVIIVPFESSVGEFHIEICSEDVA